MVDIVSRVFCTHKSIWCELFIYFAKSGLMQHCDMYMWVFFHKSIWTFLDNIYNLVDIVSLVFCTHKSIWCEIFIYFAKSGLMQHCDINMWVFAFKLYAKI